MRVSVLLFVPLSVLRAPSSTPARAPRRTSSTTGRSSTTTGRRGESGTSTSRSTTSESTSERKSPSTLLGWVRHSWIVSVRYVFASSKSKRSTKREFVKSGNRFRHVYEGRYIQGYIGPSAFCLQISRLQFTSDRYWKAEFNPTEGILHWSPLARSTFRPRKIDHESGMTLYPGY